jgi:hypothetical protein
MSWFRRRLISVASYIDMMPYVGIEDGVHYALACNGSGVVGMTHFGRVAAQQILGESIRVSSFACLSFPTEPFYGGNPWFMPIIGTAYQWRDRLDGWKLTKRGD